MPLVSMTDYLSIPVLGLKAKESFWSEKNVVYIAT